MPIQADLLPDASQGFKRVFEETDREIRQLASKKVAVMLGLIAPAAPERLSPVHFSYASIGLFEELAVENFINEVSNSKPKPKKLFLLLNSPGGALLSSYKIAKAIRETFDDITVFVPNMAFSGATLLALGGNKIIMGPMSSLSPIDPQIRMGSDFSYSALTPLKSLARWEKAFKKMTVDEAPYPIKAMVDKLDPVLIEECTLIANTSYRYAQEILTGAGYSRRDAEKIANQLVWNSPVHEYQLGIKEAREIGLNVDSCDRCAQIWRLMRKWLHKYMGKSSSTHLVGTVFPERTKSKQKSNKAKHKEVKKSRAQK